MSNHRPIRACAIRGHEFPEEPQLHTLWETDPHFQGKLMAWVERSNTIDRKIIEEDESGLFDESDLLHSLIWRDFPSIAAVDAANVALHEEKYFEELERQFADPRAAPPISTVQQRVQHDREWYRVLSQQGGRET